MSTAQLLACSLLEAADRLDPMLVKVEEAEALARAADSSIRSSVAVRMWQRAESFPKPLAGTTGHLIADTAIAPRTAATRAPVDRQPGANAPGEEWTDHRAFLRTRHIRKPRRVGGSSGRKGRKVVALGTKEVLDAA